MSESSMSESSMSAVRLETGTERPQHAISDNGPDGFGAF
jgi:hypothetical protein